MPKVHTVKAGKLKAMFTIDEPPLITGPHLAGLKFYGQQDHYSCGFLAALTVVDYFRPEVDQREVMEAVQCVDNGEGTSREKVINGLNHFKIDAEYREDMVISDLITLTEYGVPVIITVWPDDWRMDHWVVVAGFSKDQRVHLTNHYPMSLREFRREWIECWGEEWTTGAGLICSLH